MKLANKVAVVTGAAGRDRPKPAISVEPSGFRRAEWCENHQNHSENVREKLPMDILRLCVHRSLRVIIRERPKT